MPNTDQTAQATSTSSNNQAPIADEFDLGMLAPSESKTTTEEISSSTPEEASVETSNNDALDFNMDLPDSYSDTKTTETKTQETSVLDIVLPENTTQKISESAINEASSPESQQNAETSIENTITTNSTNN